MRKYVVIDTNVLVSALITRNESSPTVRILRFLADGKGRKIEPKDTRGTRTGRNWSFAVGSLPRKITASYTVVLVCDGEEKSFTYTAQLTRRSMSLWYLKLLNLMYL